ncbi:MAG: Asp-tRNA(Asn)/Glu-tRNA(Gln) amidotransferase subunit GatB [Bacteroidetes bacterium]|nr:Asp-tRNA(Asn)/Glu-tRNA(Gln) amidotransferase subunit GatB [Bacteroidota bacterium]
MKYKAVIGLEIHVQLKTKSKAFCADANQYGESPNTLISPISLGHPGTLPKHNKAAIEYATKLGLALNCNITRINHYARKNYFYADLPKGYQITQDKTPICTGGYVEITGENGQPKKIHLIRIHMEEDTGKSMHDQDIYDTLVDYNRAGVPLVEIVSEPEVASGEEAYQYLSEIRRLVRYLDICDGNMEEGSMRCDANVSVMLAESKEYGTKVEVKNMNSMTNVKRAIEYEIQRQIECIEKGEIIVSETRSFNAAKGNTTSMRSKESAQDYRYFPEPDLPPFIVTEEFLKKIKQDLPELPKVLFQRLQTDFGLSEYDAGVITDEKMLAEYYLEFTQYCPNHKAAANWLLGPIKSWMNENAKTITEFPISTQKMSELIALVDNGTVSHTAASGQILAELLANPKENPQAIAKRLNLIQTSDTDVLTGYISEVLNKYPDKVEEYKAGKKGLLGLFVGEVMKLSKGSADPKKVNELLRSSLD